jgi:glutathione synthase/RimK-type ligase-like ATP-grasp enzyme
MTVLVISALGDAHAQAVMTALAARGELEVELLDLSDFPQRLALSMAFEDGKHRFALCRPGGGILDLDRVRAVWWRRPQAFLLPESMTDAAHRRFAVSEARTAFQGLYQSMNAVWVNEPLRDAAAVNKPFQLTLAQRIGLEIPPTLMTNDPDEAVAFWQQNDGTVIYKQFLALPETWRETRRLRPQEADLVAAVRWAPVIFQRYIEAEADIRVTVIGDELFAAAADVRSGGYPTDVRLNLDAAYVSHQLPESVGAQLRRMVNELGLRYGAIDLRLTPDGRYVFLEINPAGQFLYIEQATGQKIAAALAALLASSETGTAPGSGPRDL